MAKMQEYFWVLKKGNDFKSASGTYVTPKLYMTEGQAKSAGRSRGWTPVKVRIQFLQTDNNGL